MSLYRVLYRKWRPERFCDVIGQEHVTATLKNEIRSGRISHAYLFTGSRGTGKTSCAKILSRAVNCLDSTDGEPCGKCANCVGIANGSILDVVEMDAASNNSVNNIRAVLEEVVFTPSDAKYRVYIIDEVHMLSPGAYNALLKTLEEPPPHIVFILATTEINKIPATILSRCQRFDFNRIDPHDMGKRLVEIAEEEGVQLDDEAALLIATVADGAMRDALSILDRCIGLSEKITAEIVREATGLSGRDYLFTLADSVMKEDVPLAINTINALHKASKSMSLLCEELSEHFRALMLLKTMKGSAESLIIMTKEELEKARVQSQGITLSQIVSCIETLHASRELMFRGGNNKTEFETCMIKLCTPRLSADMGAILARLEKLERSAAARLAAPPASDVKEQNYAAEAPRSDTAISVKSVKTEPQSAPVRREETLPFDENPQPEVKSQPAQNNVRPQTQRNVQSSASAAAAPQGGQGDIIAQLSARAVPMPQWEDVLEAMKSITRVTATAFRGTTAYTVDDYVLIYSDSDTVTTHLKNAGHRMKIKAAIRDVTGRNYKLGPYKPPGTEAQISAAPKSKIDEFIENISNSDIKVTVED